jgi:hypothetical protein
MQSALQYWPENWSNVDSSTLASDQIDIEPPDNTYQIHELTRPQTHNITVLASCSMPYNILYREQECHLRKIYWRRSLPQDFYQNPKIEIFYLDTPEDSLFPASGENMATLEYWPKLLEKSVLDDIKRKGVYSLNIKRKLLFSKTFTFQLSELPRKKPSAIIGKRNFEEDNA